MVFSFQAIIKNSYAVFTFRSALISRPEQLLFGFSNKKNFVLQEWSNKEFSHFSILDKIIFLSDNTIKFIASMSKSSEG